MSKTGEICVDTLKKGWKKDYGIGHVLVVRRLVSDSDKKNRYTCCCSKNADVHNADYQMLVDLPQSGKRIEWGSREAIISGLRWILQSMSSCLSNLLSSHASLMNGLTLLLQYAKLITNIHATPKVHSKRLHKQEGAPFRLCWHLVQIPPPEFRKDGAGSKSRSSSISTVHLVPNTPSFSRPSNPAFTTHTTTVPPVKPAPLGAHGKKEQSPTIEQPSVVAEERTLKPATITKVPVAAPVGKTAVPSKAKRGLKRL